ncbi:MAG: hypothetical protein QF645_08410, partial [Planctomycetota bacterium]|nr:hypothetical protein [Planctomycetota bacterium]
MKLICKGTEIYRRRPRQVKVFLLLGVLALCLGIRVAWGWCVPLDKRHFYPRDLSASLSLVEGHGLRFFPPSSLVMHESNDDVRAVREFMTQRRWRLSREELGRALRVVELKQHPNVPLFARIFEVHIVAGLWRIFGVDWGVIFFFYACLSTLACLAIFLMARRVADSAWAGLIASFLYAFSGTELIHSVWSIRDTNPTWFFIYALSWFVCRVDRPLRSGSWNAGSILMLGVLSTIGIGWRRDALMIPPFLLLGVLVVLVGKRCTWRRVVASVLLFVVGVISVLMFRSHLGREVKPTGRNALGAFHMAHYAESQRIHIANYPNFFQVERSDELTFHQAHVWQRTYYPEDTFIPYQGNYGLYCLEMFLEQARHNGYEWVKDLPEYWWMILSEVANSKAKTVVGKPSFDVPSWIFLSSLPLSVFGVFWLLWVGRNREVVLVMVALSVYYALLLWFMLPEVKHYTPMMIPLAVLGGVGGFGLLRVLLVSQERRVLRENWRPGVRFLVVLALGVASIYYSLYFLSKGVQGARRASYEEALNRLAAEDSGWVEEKTEPNRFVYSVREGDDRSSRLFAVDIEGEGGKELLRCWNQHVVIHSRLSVE